MQHANRSSIFENSDSNGGSATINNNNSIGAIGASTSGAMTPFPQYSIVLILLSSMHLALWQLCKWLSMLSTSASYRKVQKIQNRNIFKNNSNSKSSSSTTSTTVTKTLSCSRYCCQLCTRIVQFRRKPPQQQQYYDYYYNYYYYLDWVLNRVVFALIFCYHKIER